MTAESSEKAIRKYRELYWALRVPPSFPPVASQMNEFLADEDLGIINLLELLGTVPLFAGAPLRAVQSARSCLRKDAVAALGRNAGVWSRRSSGNAQKTESGRSYNPVDEETWWLRF